MNQEELKKAFDEVYQSGFKNGRIDMKNKILKTLNRDWALIPLHFAVKVLDKINKIK